MKVEPKRTALYTATVTVPESEITSHQSTVPIPKEKFVRDGEGEIEGVNITLSLREANYLRAILGKIGGASTGSIREFSSPLFHALDRIVEPRFGACYHEKNTLGVTQSMIVEPHPEF